MSNYRSGYDKTARTWIGILAVFMVLVIALAVIFGVMTKGFTDWSMFGGEEQQEQTDEASNDNLLVEANGSDRMQLNVMRAAAAESETEQITVTATITPADATNRYINWSLSFENANSEWATGKDPGDYVTVTPTDTYRNVVTLDCTEAFGEVIILTATTQDNDEITATCELNYMARYDVTQGIVLEATGAEEDITIPYETGTFALPFMNGETYTAKAGGYGVGTMQDELTITITSEYHYDSMYSTPVSAFLGKHYGSASIADMTLSPVQWDSSIVFDQELLNDTFGDHAESDYATLYSAIAEQAFVSGNGYKNYIVINVTVEGEYSGSAEYTAYGYIDPTDMGKSVTDVTLDENEIIF